MQGYVAPPAPIDANLPLIRHLSVEYTVLYRHWYPSNHADARIKSHLIQIKENFVSLRTFSFHIRALNALDEAHTNLLGNARSARGLQMLKFRLDRLDLIAFGPLNALTNFRKGIVDKNEWLQRKRLDMAFINALVSGRRRNLWSLLAKISCTREWTRMAYV